MTVWADATRPPMGHEIIANARTARGDAHDMANARLIASAPELLAALKDARERLEYLEPEYFDDASHETEWRDYLAQTDALIAKAEGKEPRP
jgi:hypothetical protein